MVPNLRDLRRSKKISQKKLAEKIGVTQQAVQQYERNKIEPDIEGLKRIADALEVSVDLLIAHESPGKDSEHVISEEEFLVIESYRKLGEYDKQSIMRIIRSLNR